MAKLFLTFGGISKVLSVLSSIFFLVALINIKTKKICKFNFIKGGVVLWVITTLFALLSYIGLCTRECPQCGTEYHYSDDLTYCVGCGDNLTNDNNNEHLCTVCGETFCTSAEVKYCGKCGVELHSTTE